MDLKRKEKTKKKKKKTKQKLKTIKFYNGVLFLIHVLTRSYYQLFPFIHSFIVNSWFIHSFSFFLFLFLFL